MKEEHVKADGGGGGAEMDEDDELVWLEESDGGEHPDDLVEEEDLGDLLSDNLNVTNTLGGSRLSRRGGLKGRRR